MFAVVPPGIRNCARVRNKNSNESCQQHLKTRCFRSLILNCSNWLFSCWLLFIIISSGTMQSITYITTIRDFCNMGVLTDVIIYVLYRKIWWIHWGSLWSPPVYCYICHQHCFASFKFALTLFSWVFGVSCFMECLPLQHLLDSSEEWHFLCSSSSWPLLSSATGSWTLVHHTKPLTNGETGEQQERTLSRDETDGQ